ncbi:MAG TPA: menaquinone biosynthesis protein [Pyrinomonadaceae bacterium]|nr:menaquinone biosynthesis protein [Pyrinomonadaceae bacterium]
MTTPFRLAASSYLNSAPLIWSFLHGSKRGQVDFVEAVPARCAQLLSQAEVEGALVPVFEYQRIVGGALVPDVCVGSQKEVLSVVLVSKDTELENIRSIALDESSRTSATLVKVIFREFLDREPAWTVRTPNLEEMLEKTDAALIIGDPGMTFPRHGLKVWDMASLWRKFTGLGFVFAMWMIADQAVERARNVDFAGARDEGVAQVAEIVAEYEKKIPMPVNELRKYLTENIVFHVDDSMKRGLQLYFELAFKHRLIESVKPLQFI